MSLKQSFYNSELNLSLTQQIQINKIILGSPKSLRSAQTLLTDSLSLLVTIVWAQSETQYMTSVQRSSLEPLKPSLSVFVLTPAWCFLCRSTRLLLSAFDLPLSYYYTFSLCQSVDLKPSASWLLVFASQLSSSPASIRLNPSVMCNHHCIMPHREVATYSVRMSVSSLEHVWTIIISVCSKNSRETWIFCQLIIHIGLQILYNSTCWPRQIRSSIRTRLHH